MRPVDPYIQLGGTQQPLDALGLAHDRRFFARPLPPKNRYDHDVVRAPLRRFRVARRALFIKVVAPFVLEFPSAPGGAAPSALFVGFS